MYSVLGSNSLEKRKLLLHTSAFIRRPASGIVAFPPELSRLSKPQEKLWIANMKADVSTTAKIWSAML